jgi:hypothetical protein
MEPAQKLLPSTSPQKKVAIHPIVLVPAHGWIAATDLLL